MAQYDGISFPGWEVVRKIGEGSFGGVYEIQRTLPGGKVEKCALKRLTIPRDDGEIRELYSQSFSKESITAHYKNQMGELVNEYTLALELNGCKNVVACHDVKCIQHEDNIGWDIYIRMELLKPLKQMLGPEYREIIVLKLGLSMCNALLACQQHNIIHRDIKPENILVSPAGEFKLGDFGIAKVSEKTATGTLTGTTGYMAPEVANRWHYGFSADIYSLGMVLYWMMNQRTLPFLPLPPQIPTALQRQEAANRRFAGESFRPPVNGSPELKQIVMKACAFSPEERYRTVKELRRDLYACYQHEKNSEAGVDTYSEILQELGLPEDTLSMPASASIHEKTGAGIRQNGASSLPARKMPGAYAKTPDREETHGSVRQSSIRKSSPTAPKAQPGKKRRYALACLLAAAAIAFGAAVGIALSKFTNLFNVTAKIEAPPAQQQTASGSYQAASEQSQITLPQSTEPHRTAEATEKAANNSTDRLEKQIQESPAAATAQLSKTAFRALLEYQTPQTIRFMDSQQGAPENAADLSEKQDGSILGWWNADTLMVAGRGKIYAPEDCSGLFKDCDELVEIDWNGCFDTSKVTNMSAMFDACNSLTNLDVSGFDTSKVTDMGWMFHDCSSLTNLDVSGFDTSKVTDMSVMFAECDSLTNLDVLGFDTSKVTDMSLMFGFCSGLTRLDFSGFDTSNVTNMASMFFSCSRLVKLDVSSFNTSNVTKMGLMFHGCNNLTKLDVSGFDTSKVTNMNGMFAYCSGLISLDVSSFDTSNVEVMSEMFSGCSRIINLDVSGFDTSKVTDMRGMFDGCDRAKINWGNFDRHGLMQADLFGSGTNTRLSRTAFDNLLRQKSVRRVQFTYSQQGAPKNAADLSEKQDGSILGWWNADTLMVAGRGKIYAPEDCSGLFEYCHVLIKIDWNDCLDTSKVTNMSSMFNGCRMASLDVSTFDTSKVQTVEKPQFYVRQNWGFE